jgi:hypothetical protein
MPIHEEKVPLAPEEFAEKARVQWLNSVGWVLLVILVVVFFVDIIALVDMLYHSSGGTITELMAACVMTVFLSVTLLTFTFFFLSGFGLVRSSESFQKWLGGITVAELAGMAATVIAYYFKVKK